MDREHKWRFSSRGSHYIVTVIKMTRDKVFYKFHSNNKVITESKQSFDRRFDRYK
jgi:hypothetical protein